MNIFEVATLIMILLGAFIGYQLASPCSVVLGILVSVLGAASGVILGPLLSVTFLLPFEGLARICRKLASGKWTDPSLDNDAVPGDE